MDIASISQLKSSVTRSTPDYMYIIIMFLSLWVLVRRTSQFNYVLLTKDLPLSTNQCCTMHAKRTRLCRSQKAPTVAQEVQVLCIQRPLWALLENLYDHAHWHNFIGLATCWRAASLILPSFWSLVLSTMTCLYLWKNLKSVHALSCILLTLTNEIN